MIKKIWNIITTIIMIAMVLLAGVFFAPRVFGITPMAVLSGSMEPNFHVGSLVFVKETDMSNVEVGDPITFKLSEDTLVTHRAIEITEKGIKTQGDANNSEDGSLVNKSNFVGKAYDFSIPMLGYLAVYINSPAGIIVLVTIVLISMLISYIIDLIYKKEDKDSEVE